VQDKDEEQEEGGYGHSTDPSKASSSFPLCSIEPISCLV
jgi:hypothetical protein